MAWDLASASPSDAALEWDLASPSGVALEWDLRCRLSASEWEMPKS